MRKRYKILMGCAIAIGALILAAGIILFVISRDEPPPDDSDLIVKRLDIPDDQNGFTYFQQAAEVLYWPGTEAWEKAGKHPYPEDIYADPEDPLSEVATETRDRLDKMLDGKDWDEALAAEVLDANKPTFALIEKGLACREFQFPVVIGFDDLPGPAMSLMKLGTLGILRARAWSMNGQEDQALEQSLKVIELGDRVLSGKGLLISGLVGMTVRSMGINTFRQIATKATLPPERLWPYARRLAKYQSCDEGLAETMRAEHEWAIRIADEYVGKELWKANRGFLFSGMYYKPNQTKRFLSDVHRAVIESLAKPLAEVKDLSPPWREDLGTVGRLWGGNVCGKMLYVLTAPGLKDVTRLKCQDRTEFAATQMLLALKCHKMKNGHLPKTLDELVPEYLAAVPLDDFDGKPLRYSPEKKILYSVGKDLKDVGGFTKEETLKWWQEANPTQPPEDAPLDPPVWNLPNPSWPIEF